MANINTNFIDFLGSYNICVPIIQRDYVQGSNMHAAKRNDFLNVLLAAISNPDGHCELDFIYGSVAGGQFLPLDGQQRLTTLYLLHWYMIARCNNQPEAQFSQLKGIKKWETHQLKYETRISSSVFCSKIKELTKIDNTEKVSEVITEQSWFSEDWLFDPSVVAMLQLLDALAQKVNALLTQGITITTMLQRLLGANSINFDQLDMGEYQLTDSLYIKMNGRGKQLTPFENWKARFIQFLEDNFSESKYDLFDESRSNYSDSLKKYFTHSIEHEWTDLLWHYAVVDYKSRRDEYEKLSNDEKRSAYLTSPLIDDYFTHFYNYILKMCYYAQTAERETSVVFTDKKNWEIVNDVKVVKFMFWTLDFFAKISRQSKGVDNYFNQLFYVNSDDDTIVNSHTRLFADEDEANDNGTDLFRMLITNQCSVSNQVLLFMLLNFCKHNNAYEVTPELKQFARWCRNYLENKNQRLAQDMKMHSNVRMNDLSIYLKEAQRFVKAPTKLTEALNDDKYICVENSAYTHGNIEAFDLSKPIEDNIALFKAFREAKDLVKVRVLIAYGFKGASWGWSAHGTRYFFGKGGRWDTLFRHSETANALRPVISAIVDDFKNIHNLEKMIEAKLIEFKNKRQYDFTYYMLRYDDFAESSLWWMIDEGKTGCHFFAKESDYDVISIPRFNSHPLNGYHTDPYACTIAQYLKVNHKDLYKDRKIDYSGSNRDKAWITYKGENIMYFTSDGINYVDHGSIKSIKVGTNEDRIEKATSLLLKILGVSRKI